MQKELNKKLRLDSINWVEVIDGLEGKTTFTAHDIKRALKKTGRSFNNNGPFHSAVKSFIKALGNTVTSTMLSGEVVYKITSTEEAIRTVDCKRKTIKTAGVGLGSSAFAGLGLATINSKPKNQIMAPSDEDKIRGLFKRSYVPLEHAICLLAVFIKHAESKLSSKVIKTEITELGINFGTFTTTSKAIINEIFERLGYNKLIIHKFSMKSSWELEGEKDLLDEYTHLSEVYEKLTGKKPKNLDDYITTSTTKEEVERRFEIIKELEEQSKKRPIEIRIEKDQEIAWKKWLLVLASKNILGASRSISNLVSWIKTSRYYEIDEKEAEKLYHEMMEDTRNELHYNFSGYVTMSDKAWKILSKHYSPLNMKETIFIKLPIPLETASHVFPGLEFKLDDTTTSGMYLYTVGLNRSMSCELSLKKLLRFIQISGKIYTDNSWMVKRVLDIISKEDSTEKSKNVPLLSIEEKI